MKHKSQSVSKITASAPLPLPDVRVLQTRKNIDDAFVKLLLQRSYRNLRVSDITRKAAIGRATFYAHFRSKDELLKSQLNRMLIPMLTPNPGSPSLINCRALFAHVRTAPKLFHSIMGEGEISGLRVVSAALEAWLDKLLPQPNTTDTPLPVSLVKRFVLSTLLTIISHGLQPGSSDSAEAMQFQFEKLVSSGLSVD